MLNKKHEKKYVCNLEIHIYNLSIATYRYVIYRENLYIQNLGKTN